MSENPSYYPSEYYQRTEKPRPPLVVWVEVPLTAADAADLYRGLSKAGWKDAHMPGDSVVTVNGSKLQKVVLQ